MHSASIFDKTLAAIRVLDELSARTQRNLEKQAASNTAIVQKSAIAGDLLLKKEFIEPHQKQAAATGVQDPEQCLDLLIEVLNRTNNSQPESIGAPVTREKRAGSYSIGSHIADHDETPQGRAFREHILRGM